jgi:hypothetical protein
VKRTCFESANPFNGVSIRMHRETIKFSAGHEVPLLRVRQNASAREISENLSISPPRAVVCLNGGTAELDEGLAMHLESLLVDGLARVTAEESLTVVTGATDAGIFSLFGKGIEKWGKRAPVIGIAPEKLVRWGSGTGGDTPLEPHHSHFVLVEGEEWGDESGTMYALVNEWGNQCPTVAVFAGGGQVTLREMRANVMQGRKMILLAGSGRATDAVLAARGGERSAARPVHDIAAAGDIISFSLQSEPPSLARLVRGLLLDPRKKH